MNDIGKIKLLIGAIAILASIACRGEEFTIPGNFATINAALAGAPDGSTIYVGPGTYPDYIQSLNLNKDLYFRSTGGPDVTVIDGGGSRNLLIIANNNTGNSEKNLVFDGFTFANGWSSGPAQSPVTIAEAKPTFINCIFRNNGSAEKGGAVLAYGTPTHARFLSCIFRDNISQQTAGAALINGGHAQATFKKCLFERNTNRWSDPSAADNFAGAVYYSIAGGALIDCIFRDNTTSYAGGAVVSLTLFDQGEDDLLIEGCLFEDNLAEPLSGQTAPANTEAGAVFVEGNVNVHIYRSKFVNNRAQGGGAVQSFRANLTIEDSVFINNQAQGGLGTGGAISMSNNDIGFGDAREGTLIVSNVLVRGCSGHAGGGVYVSGDNTYNKQTPAFFHRVVIDSCSTTENNGYDGHGGGLFLADVDMTARELYLINNTASQGGGGGMTLVANTDFTAFDSYVIGNQANGINHAVYDPQNNNPSWNQTYFGHNPPGSGGGNITWLAEVMDYMLFGESHLTYGVSPDGGNPKVNPGNVSLSDNGAYRAGSLSLSVADTTTYSLSTSPGDTAQVEYSLRSPGAAFPSAPPVAPLFLEAENFDRGGNGIGYYDRSVSNVGNPYRSEESVEIASSGTASGGRFVGWITGGEWMEYTFDVPVNGTYEFLVSAASPDGTGKFQLYLDDTSLNGIQTVNPTGGWDTWQNFAAGSVSLDAGWYTLRMQHVHSGFSFDGITVQVQTTNPVLSVSTDALNFFAKEGVTPAPQTFTVRNSGSAMLNYQISSNQSWVSLSPVSGTSSGESDSIQVSIDPSGMTSGVYNAEIDVTSNAENPDETIAVSLNIREDSLNPLDFDGDGRADLAVFRPSDGTWFIRSSVSDSTSSTVWGLLPSDIPVAGDYDGDGFADIATYQANGTWHLARTSAGYAGLQLGNSVIVNVPADYDGDGSTDMAIYEPWSGVWHISRSSLGYTGVVWGQPGDIPVPADYDGDGFDDIAVFRPSSQEWLLVRSSDGPVTRQWGLLPSDQPVPGDYDGDGFADLAVYQANGTWHLARSSAGYAGLQLGGPGDIPVPADYDGDGAIDMAIYETKGVWHLSQTTDGYRGVVLGGSDTVPVKAAPNY